MDENVSVPYSRSVRQAYARTRILIGVDKQEKQAFGRRLRQARDAKAISQDHVATWFDIDRASVASWELGSTLPSADKLPVICRRLGVSLDYLFNTKSGKPYTTSQVNPDTEIDTDLLETIISEVEVHFVSYRPLPSPGQRARMMGAMYDDCRDSGRRPNQKMVTRYLKLVA